MTEAATSRAFAALALPGAIDLLTAAAEGRPLGPSAVRDALLDAGLLIGAEDGGFRPARAVLLDLADLITAPLTAGQDPGFAIPRMG
ncbi:hypothetical protein PJ900_18480 [Tistrella mobilis]|uniref:Uncharacterized protein n=1 Tax=Tistrella mobilis TaxID=171437 RepID=A0A162KKK3_9PROT|nr:hypothetical protein [Tistrella mobilis]KYO51500.1 hypothetical protein AUP44_08900 [Tistrella mobilis]